MIIGIGGISTAGKSKLAEWIQSQVAGRKTIVLCQDNYAMPTPQIPVINGHTNWEIPESLDFDLFYANISDAAKENDIVIAEGLFVFYEQRLLDLFDKKIFLQISKRTFLARKKTDLRWGKEPLWYMEHIWKSHHMYCQSIGEKTDAFIISGENPVETGKVMRYLGL